MSVSYEINFDGIVGPTHNYAGLSRGNLASQKNRSSKSNPRQAALQGLAKMKFLHDLGLQQAVLPPHHRPDVEALRRLGFTGSDTDILQKAHRDSPHLLSAVASSSGMWAANAATISPSPDTDDGRVHITPANLVTQFHRALEPQTTQRILKAIFPDETHFAHHPPLIPSVHFSDEGAANHTRLCRDFGQSAVEVFVYGRSPFAAEDHQTKFPARQSLDASAAIARLHQLDPTYTCLVRQNPSAIDAGVFHNDVICVGQRNLFLYHELAFADEASLRELGRMFEELTHEPLTMLRVSNQMLPIEDAVSSYLFNSQLVTLPSGDFALIAPTDCNDSDSAKRTIAWLLATSPIRRVEFVDVRQSMRNGGGPACLRLRVELAAEELDATHQGVLFTDDLFHRLTTWITRHYREQLTANDLADPKLLEESQTALDELTGILRLPPIYPFQF